MELPQKNVKICPPKVTFSGLSRNHPALTEGMTIFISVRDSAGSHPVLFVVHPTKPGESFENTCATVTFETRLTKICFKQNHERHQLVDNLLFIYLWFFHLKTFCVTNNGCLFFFIFATAFPLLNFRLHLWRWRHPARVFERFPTIIRLETNSGVTQWLHFRSLWEDMGKLPILSKNVRFSELPYKAFKMLELIKKQHKRKLIDSVWDYLAEMLDRIGWKSFSWAFAPELAHSRVFWMST